MCSGRIVGQPDVIPAARNISTGDKSQLHSKPLLDRVNECNRLISSIGHPTHHRSGILERADFSAIEGLGYRIAPSNQIA